MRYRYLSLLAAAVISACGGDLKTTAPPPPQTPALLKDVVVDRLPSPYYHFDYDATGRIAGASFASGFRIYQVAYVGDRITELRNNAVGNTDVLKYFYDDLGRVARIDYLDANGQVFTHVNFTYVGQQLTKIERDRLAASSFIIDKTMTFSYYADGNLQEITDHRPAIDGFQPDATTTDRFEGYDSGINVDGFGLIHNDFFDNLVLLPGVILQKGNPARETFSGDGTSNFTVDYTYTYDERNRPLTKSGDAVFSNGPNAGQHFPVVSVFTYY
jgi:hypothetical protein